ncbi:MAG: hypothetical protein M3069_11945 [Chloroflexota bacterium]|nr:hypothetical protein [Chloroflexota bacterium]
MLDLATGQMAQVIDSPQALAAADQVGGAAFSQRTGVKLWSMQLTGQNNRLVWIVQYGAPVITQQERLTITLDAVTNAVLNELRLEI